MPVIQYSVPTEVYVALVQRAALLGLTEHQLARALMNASPATDEELLAAHRATQRIAKAQRARPL